MKLPKRQLVRLGWLSGSTSMDDMSPILNSQLSYKEQINLLRLVSVTVEAIGQLAPPMNMFAYWPS
jgi:hypothetical protein